MPGQPSKPNCECCKSEDAQAATGAKATPGHVDTRFLFAESSISSPSPRNNLSMWILDSTGDVLNGRRVWLRPGKRYLFGRENVLHAIPNKTVSRHHMTIEVSAVKERDGTRTHARTKVTVTDLNSSKGTTVDDQQIKGQEHVLEGTEHSIKIGRYPHAFRIKWEPVVLSFSFSSKEMRASDPLADVRSRVEALDIKTIIPYLVGHTTHVVQNKRNTAKGLQALINGKYIVQYSYIDALVYATTPSNLESEESLCPLEVDYDSAWPDAAEHLPRRGTSPSSVQLWHLPRILLASTSLRGKALFYEIQDGQTTAAEIAQFMREAAGQKGMGRGRQDLGGVVLVRFRSKGEKRCRSSLPSVASRGWSRSSRKLPQPPAAETQTAPTPSQSQSPPTLQENRSSTRAKAPRVRSFVSKMKTFDDGFDMESIPVYTPEDNPAMDAQAIDVIPAQTSKHSKALPVVDEHAQEDVVADLLPGARAMKRRRAEMNEPHRSTDASRTELEAAPKPKRAKLDVLEEVKKHREEEEQHWKAEQDPQPSQEVNVEDLKNLAIVEEMDIPARNLPTRGHETSDRWDDGWNGRKNFKRFRRKGEPRHARQRVQSVIVPLEEMTRRDFGIGEHHWVSSRKSPEQEQPSRQEDPSEVASHQDHTLSPSEAYMPHPSATVLESSPEPRPLLSRHRSQKRPRETRDSDSDEETRFRFRRKR
ncbi:hypothetical protein N7492_004147 [Penicillium capsulatum]|uniref:FHA domain-containing protein n=1 Tax=Penicillium capsulatum TaxID=69766 RepID=A0A9W9LY39_9EURO|nr:hypothetical protein N7492_004147 [Penicillium capsulatum]